MVSSCVFTNVIQKKLLNEFAENLILLCEASALSVKVFKMSLRTSSMRFSVLLSESVCEISFYTIS